MRLVRCLPLPLVALCLACPPGPHPAAGGADSGTPEDPAREAFAAEVQAGLRDGGETNVRYDPEQFRITYGADGGSEMNLANLWVEYRGAADKDAALRQFLQSRNGLDLPARFEEAAPHLLPAVRARFTFEYTRYRKPGKALAPYQDIAGGIAAGVVYDGEASMQFITDEQLATWKVTLDRAMSVAVKNLEGRSQERFKRLGPGMFASPWHDNYDTARLLLPATLSKLPLKGNPVATLPNRDTLLVAGSADERGLSTLASATGEALKEPRPISAMPLVYEKGAWHPFLPSGSGVLREQFHGMQLGARESDYADQKQALDQMNERDGLDIFVASFTVIENAKTQRKLSYCVWSNHVDSWLPEAEFVVFGDSDGVHPKSFHTAAIAPWTKVQAAVGRRLKPLGYHPERYEVKTFPTAAELEAFGFAPEFPKPK